jgi:hypothetical protein
MVSWVGALGHKELAWVGCTIRLEEVKRENAAVDRATVCCWRVRLAGVPVAQSRHPRGCRLVVSGLAKAIADHDNNHSRIAHLTVPGKSDGPVPSTV